MKPIRPCLPILFSALFVFLFPNAIAAERLHGPGQTKQEVIAALDKTIPDLMAKARIPGLSAALVWDGEVVWEKGYGIKDKLTREPVDSKTVFEAASLTKPFFATMAMTLIDSGLIDLDRPLIEYVPQDSIEKAIGHPFSQPGFRADWFKRITARMALSHSSGLPHGQRGTPYPILFEPGTRFSYSADGYYYLQKVVEYLFREPLGETMRTRVIEPLHMDRSSMVWDDRFTANAAIGHNMLGISNGTVRKYTEAHSAASLYTTAGDYARYVAAVMNGTYPGLRSVDLMLTPQVRVADSVKWSLGFGIEETSAGPAFFQWGDYGIFRNYIVALEGPKRALVYLTNSFYGLAVGQELVAAATGIEEDYGLRWLHYASYDSETSRFFYAVAEKPVGESVRLYHELKAKDSPAVRENIVNEIAYGLLRSGANDKALAFFELNVKAYPASANVYDSMGEGLEAAGDTARAETYFQKAIDAIPADTTLDETTKTRYGTLFHEHLARAKGRSKN